MGLRLLLRNSLNPSRRALPRELVQPQGDVAAVEAGDRNHRPLRVKEPGSGAFFETEGPAADRPAGFHILRAAFFAGGRLVHFAPPIRSS